MSMEKRYFTSDSTIRSYASFTDCVVVSDADDPHQSAVVTAAI